MLRRGLGTAIRPVSPLHKAQEDAYGNKPHVTAAAPGRSDPRILTREEETISVPTPRPYPYPRPPPLADNASTGRVDTSGARTHAQHSGGRGCCSLPVEAAPQHFPGPREGRRTLYNRWRLDSAVQCRLRPPRHRHCRRAPLLTTQHPCPHLRRSSRTHARPRARPTHPGPAPRTTGHGRSEDDAPRYPRRRAMERPRPCPARTCQASSRSPFPGSRPTTP
ncbi:hypothetical protein B0H17DRAFT_641026 [Mycena rosella]|uniref:Uncharacterized protein n=1 Tax=Mycena rosella TaxID=1033263 RepID=A0AAD7GG18_MYCRO|nr:hypothetical protein B0H17DRAFT_641026 [Mycena rosella]